MRHIIRMTLRKASSKEPKTLGVDFDGTIVKASRPMKSFSEVVLEDDVKETMTELKRRGWFIIIDTCRPDKKGVTKFLKSKEIPFDTVGVNPYAPPDVGKDKLYCDVKIDDKVTQFRGWKHAIQDIDDTYEKHQKDLKD